jgi:tungstate transport system ATP-binding protein
MAVATLVDVAGALPGRGMVGLGRGTTVYHVQSLKQMYSGRAVLDIDDLSIEQGEILALVGPSGAGKSTLLRLLNFLETPSSGTIIYCGQPIECTVALDIRRQVTTVFQRPVLQRASVRDNVSYGLRLRGMSVDGSVDKMLTRVGLDDLARHAAHHLSGGEMQRVALARALVVQPRVLLLDEPTANLDPYNVGLIEDIIRSTNAERATTIVLVTHNVFQARRLAHRTGLLLGGKLIELADTATFFSSPSDQRTAAFVRGDMVY